MFPQTCQSKVFDLSDGVSQYAWFPCREARESSWGYPNYWLKVRPISIKCQVTSRTSFEKANAICYSDLACEE